MATAAILLAAGRSRRFGHSNKLLCTIGGKALVAHAAAALRDAQFDRLLAVVSDDEVASHLPDFEIVQPDDPTASQSLSLRAAIRHAQETGVTRSVIALGDMPFVTPALLHAVEAACTLSTPSAATDGRRPVPPACFPESLYGDLLTLKGDRGAAALLAGLDPRFLVPAPARVLHDIDTVEDLALAEQWLNDMQS